EVVEDRHQKSPGLCRDVVVGAELGRHLRAGLVEPPEQVRAAEQEDDHPHDAALDRPPLGRGHHNRLSGLRRLGRRRHGGRLRRRLLGLPVRGRSRWLLRLAVRRLVGIGRRAHAFGPYSRCKTPCTRQGGEESAIRSRRSRPDRAVRLALAMTRRGNYSSGDDFVLEYGELRFTFNERDFGERCEQAARKVGFVSGQLSVSESEDLVNLVVNGEVQDPASALGEHVNDCWPELVGPAERSLVHWLRRLVFRSAWLDQRVKEGELDVVFDDATQSFGYVQPERDREPIELSPEPNWGRVAYQPR